MRITEIKDKEEHIMATERERKWVIAKDSIALQELSELALNIEQLDQGYIASDKGISVKTLVNGKSFLLANDVLLCEISQDTLNELMSDIYNSEQEKFPDEVEVRYRLKKSETIGYEKRILTIKDKGDLANRGEVEFPISEEVFNSLKASSISSINKVRYSIEDLKNILEFDYYKEPSFDFISIETEFETAEEMDAYNLPDWVQELDPQEVTLEKSFKNKNLSEKPDVAAELFARLFDRSL